MYFAVHAALGDDSLDDDISTTRSPRAKAEKEKKAHWNPPEGLFLTPADFG
jgi:hypothetical protein